MDFIPQIRRENVANTNGGIDTIMLKVKMAPTNAEDGRGVTICGVDCWDYIASPYYVASKMGVVYSSLSHKKKSDEVKVLDIGCGDGYALRAIKRSLRKEGYESVSTYGIEVSSFLAGLAEKKGAIVYEANLLYETSLLNKVYGQADLIYLYRPIREGRAYIDLLTRIWRAMKLGAMLIQVSDLVELPHDLNPNEIIELNRGLLDLINRDGLVDLVVLAKKYVTVNDRSRRV